MIVEAKKSVCQVKFENEKGKDLNRWDVCNG